MQNGGQTLASIEKALRDLQNEERRLQSLLEDANRTRGELVADRLGAFRDLALVRANNALADGVVDQADRLSQQVTGILQARQKTVDALHIRADEAEVQREQQLKSYHGVLSNIEKLEARLDKLGEEARAKLAGNRKYAQAKEQSEQALSIYQRAEEKTTQAEKNSVKKGASYEGDPLFMYLWRRSYDRSGYMASRLIKWLDDKVADLIGYHDARANYAMLNEIPIRLGQHVQRLGEKLKGAQDAVFEIEAAKIQTLAGKDLPKELEEARNKQTRMNKQLEKLTGELSETVAQINVYAEGRDRSFRRAIELSASFLEQEDLETLKALARTTIEPSDDQIVLRIQNIDNRVEKLRKENQEFESKLERTFERKEELIKLSADFRHSYYDDSSSVFMPGSDLDELLRLLLQGAITGADYWARAQGGHRWRDRPADPYRRASRLPPFRGGFNWPTGGGGRSSGGGFSTGGGF